MAHPSKQNRTYKSQKNLAVFSAVGLQMSKVVSFIEGYTGKEASLGYQILEINSCNFCPHHGYGVDQFGKQTENEYCYKECRHIGNFNTVLEFPDWCPLPDKGGKRG